MRKAVRELPPVRSHQWVDFVDLMMHRAIARKIRREPKLFNRARRNIARWEKRNRGCSQPLREWKEILRANEMTEVLRLITRANDEGDRMRQCSPFVGVLTQDEVRKIWARYDQE